MMKILYFGNVLSRHGYTPTIIESLSSLLDSDDIRVYTSSDKKNKCLRLLDMIYFFFRNKNGTTTVLIDTYSTLNFWYAAVIALLSYLSNIKYIPILHGGKLPEWLDASPTISKKIFTNSAINVAPSEYICKAFRERGYANTVVIHNFIDETKYRATRRKKIVVPKLLWVRSFSPIYNPIMALMLLKELKKKYPDATLLMVGGCNGGKECLNMVQSKAEELGLASSVEFTGKLSKNEWHARSEECNIFINTTNADNQPVSVIEAMALGLPVISTNVGGIPYIITNEVDGMLVEPNDVKAMAECVNKLINDVAFLNDVTDMSIKRVQSFYSSSVKEEWKNLLYKINNK